MLQVQSINCHFVLFLRWEVDGDVIRSEHGADEDGWGGWLLYQDGTEDNRYGSSILAMAPGDRGDRPYVRYFWHVLVEEPAAPAVLVSAVLALDDVAVDLPPVEEYKTIINALNIQLFHPFTSGWARPRTSPA